MFASHDLLSILENYSNKDINLNTYLVSAANTARHQCFYFCAWATCFHSAFYTLCSSGS